MLDFLPYIFKYRWGYLKGFVALIVVNLLGAYLPQVVKEAVDLLKLDAIDFAIIKNAIIWLISLALIMAVFRVFSRQVIFSIGRQIEFDLKRDIFNHVVKLQPSFFNEQRTGDLISIITNDVQSLRSLGGFAMLNIANTVIAFAVVLPLMFKLHANLTWAFLLLIPTILFFIVSLASSIKKFQDAVQVSLGEISNFIEENLSGIHIIKAYGQEESELSRFHGFNKTLKKNYLKLIGVRSLIGPVMRVIASLGFVLLLYFGGKGVIDESFSAGDFAAYSLYIQRLIWPVATLGWLLTVVYRAQVSQKRISKILDEKPSICDHDGSIEKKSFDNEIILTGINHDGGDIRISKNKNLAIVGSIASGKTVLANKLMHLKELNDKEILIDGIDIKDIKLNDLRTLINLVPQESFLFSTSIKENIAYAVDLEDKEIEELANLVNLHDEVSNFKDGYETIVGERGITLSGGQRQRVAIARALALEPEILILDDAFSSLDNDSAASILSKILERRKGKTTILITHKIKLIRYFDEVMDMDKFKVRFFGKPENLDWEVESEK